MTNFTKEQKQEVKEIIKESILSHDEEKDIDQEMKEHHILNSQCIDKYLLLLPQLVIGAIIAFLHGNNFENYKEGLLYLVLLAFLASSFAFISILMARSATDDHTKPLFNLEIDIAKGCSTISLILNTVLYVVFICLLLSKIGG